MSASEPLREEALLQRCPRCTYRLRGLPAVHACPECGFEVDRRWTVFGGRSAALGPRWVTDQTMLLVILLPATVVSGIAAYLAQVVWIALLPAVVIVLLLLLMRWPPRAFVALGPTGVYVYRKRGRVEQYPWALVEKARHDLLTKSVSFGVADRRVSLKTFDLFRFNMVAADEFIRTFNRYPRDAQPEPLPNPESRTLTPDP